MVGSYLLRTVTRPDLTIDLLVEMPAEILHHKDFLNRKYLHKRQLYLGHIATQLRLHASVAAVHFSAFCSDTSKPCVLLKPAGLSGLSSKFSVRILAAPPPDTFPLARFRPSRNNVRLPGVTDIAEQPPTPTYNTAIAEDLRMVHHLQLIHAEFCNCVALAERLGVKEAVGERVGDCEGGSPLGLREPEGVPQAVALRVALNDCVPLAEALRDGVTEGVGLRVALRKGVPLGLALRDEVALRVALLDGAKLGVALLDGVALGVALLDGVELCVALLDGVPLYVVLRLGLTEVESAVP
jgi:hypothetical protein